MPHTLDPVFQNGLAGYYFLVALLNFGFAAYYVWGNKKPGLAVLWAAVGGLFLLHFVLYAVHSGPALPSAGKAAVDFLMGPVTYSTLSAVAFILFLVFRRFFVNPQVAWAVLDISLLAAGWAMT